MRQFPKGRLRKEFGRRIPEVGWGQAWLEYNEGLMGVIITFILLCVVARIFLKSL